MTPVKVLSPRVRVMPWTPHAAGFARGVVLRPSPTILMGRPQRGQSRAPIAPQSANWRCLARNLRRSGVQPANYSPLESRSPRALVNDLLMSRFKTRWCALSFLAMLAAPSTAQAALDSCGGVFLSGDAQCEFRRQQDCEDHCEVVSVEESCAATLYSSCESECTATASSKCTQDCAPVCVDQCTTTNTESSQDICRDTCLSDCNVKCADAQNPECCQHACPQTCNRKCEERCHGDDQKVDCAPKCVTACDGTCTSTSDTSCQVDCQTVQWESCQTTIHEKCRTDCTDKGGAIFCNGEFLNADNLKDCAAELSAQLSISVDVSASIDTHIDTNGDGHSERASCSMGSPAAPKSNLLWLVPALFGIAAIRRRRARRT